MRAITCFAETGEAAATVWPVTRAGLDAFIASRSPFEQAFIAGRQFRADAGKILALPTPSGDIGAYVLGRGGDEAESWAGSAAASLPVGDYQLEGLGPKELERAALSWALGAYQFTSYRAAKRPPARLFAGALEPSLLAACEAIYLVRDLVNTPANHMTPADLEAAARGLAGRHDADIRVLTGDELLAAGLNLIHGVGRASDVAPRLIDLTWGESKHPKVTLVGKGVCFDSGGLDIKNAAGMGLMKKDMGGGAHVLGLAHMIMAAGLPVRLRVLVPAVENAISAGAFRPGDVIRSHKGLTVEIGNTDAEGRLILADALSVADEEAPDLLIDMATLTGAARAALGPDLPALFTPDDAFAASLAEAGSAEGDPLWRLPLWAPYAKWLESPIADINNNAAKSFAGATTAALFLGRFVEKAKVWAHLDIYAWSLATTPTQTVGGEAYAIRALFRVISTRFS